MHIIHLVLGKANPDRMNGVNKVVDNLAKEQTALGYRVSVWGITPDPKEKTTERIYDMNLFQAKRNKLILDKEIKKAIEECPGDTVFHIHGGFIPEFYHFTKLLHKHGLDYILTPHGNYAANALRKNGLIKSIYFNLFEKNILSTSKAIHCLGEGEKNDINKVHALSKKLLIPNGQRMEDIPKAIMAKEHGNPVFGYCGRITRDQKGLDLLIEGFKKYKDQKGAGELRLIGNGEYLNELSKYVKKNNLIESVFFLGVRYGDDKFNEIAAMDAFYHPSRNEGLPTAVLEAAATGVPCVVSAFTNMGETIEKSNAGIFLKENTPDEICASMFQIESWKKENKIKQIGQNAVNMIKIDFDWNTIAQKLINVYEE
jgi:glycosyltransferase involved in cell wall biosynthesis